MGGDTAEVCDIKFSNDGKSMLLTTTNNHVYLLDAYHGDKVNFVMDACFQLVITAAKFAKPFLIGFVVVPILQKCGFSMDSSVNATIEATFTPDGQYVLSGTASLLNLPKKSFYLKSSCGMLPPILLTNCLFWSCCFWK